MQFYAILFMALMLAGCGDDAMKQQVEQQKTDREESWRGAEVVRICHDGTRIYRLKDGSLRSGWNQKYAGTDPAALCS